MKTQVILKTLVSCLMLGSFVGCNNSDSKYQSQLVLKAKQLEQSRKDTATDTRNPLPTEDSTDENPMQTYNDIKDNSASSDTTSASSDNTKVASADNSKATSYDNSSVQAKKSSDDQTTVQSGLPKVTLIPNPNLKASSDKTVAASMDGSIAESTDSTMASSKPDITKLKFTEIKILDESLLKTVSKDDFRVLFENYLSTDARAQGMMSRRAFGLACKFTVTGELAKGDKLSFKDITTQVANENGADSKLSVKFENNKTKLEMNCLYQGKLYQKYFEENFFEVVDFKTAIGTYKSETEKQLDYKDLVEKTKSFKIVNVENLKKIEVNNTASNQKRYGIVEGKLIEESKAIDLVRNGRARQACAIIGVVGELKKEQIFTQAGVKPLMEDPDNNYAEMQIFYSNDTDKAEVAVHCVLRRNGVNPGIIFETFKGTLEYGAK